MGGGGKKGRGRKNERDREGDVDVKEKGVEREGCGRRKKEAARGEALLWI